MDYIRDIVLGGATLFESHLVVSGGMYTAALILAMKAFYNIFVIWLITKIGLMLFSFTTDLVDLDSAISLPLLRWVGIYLYPFKT